MSKKQQRRLGNAALGTDYTLSKTKENADALFNTYGFMAAADKYKRLDGLERNAFVLSKLANAYRLNGEYEKAEQQYSEYINRAPDAEDLLHYAEVLQINGKCEDAARWNREYLNRTMDAERELFTECDFVKEIKKRDNIEVNNLQAINTAGMDFSPITYRDGVVFTSDRETHRLTKKKDLWTKDNFTDLFFAKVSEDGLPTGEAELFGSDLNEQLHDGTPTFNQEGTEMIFSRSDTEGETPDGVKELQLYIAKMQDGEWLPAEKLSISKSAYSYTHPTLNQDGTKLYFSSNKKEGGYGGMDIWVSQKVDGEWKRPVNLGPNVNTQENEIFPHLAIDNTLYFASNGHAGLGGLDIFSVRQGSKNNDRTWSNRANLGTPFNSQKDDFAFTMHGKGDTGYFTSNREGGVGEDDIYAWSGDLENVKLERDVLVLDKETEMRLPKIEVEIKDPTTGLDINALTDMNGEFVLPIKKDDTYNFTVKTPGYLPYTKEMTGDEMLEVDVNRLELTPITSIMTDGQTIDRLDGSPVSNAKVTIYNLCTGESREIESDANGDFVFETLCACDYRLVGEKQNYSDGINIYSVACRNCKTLTDAKSPVTVDLKMEPVAPTLSDYRTAPVRTDGTLNKYFLGSDDMAFEKGQVIRLSNLYYDFDKYNIRPDAQDDLNHVYDLLMTYPTMKIALLSHTDSRGSDRYNTRLSQKRAFSARDWLINKGVHPDRLTSVGVGEGLPVNDCTDGTDCEEDEHQLNRRTEIKINALDEPGIKVVRD